MAEVGLSVKAACRGIVQFLLSPSQIIKELTFFGKLPHTSFTQHLQVAELQINQGICAFKVFNMLLNVKGGARMLSEVKSKVANFVSLLDAYIESNQVTSSIFIVHDVVVVKLYQYIWAQPSLVELASLRKLLLMPPSAI